MLYQINPKTNEVVTTFKNITEAAKKLQVNRQTIQRAVSGLQATAHGSRWMIESPACKVKTRRKVEEINIAKQMANELGGDWKEFLA